MNRFLSIFLFAIIFCGLTFGAFAEVVPDQCHQGCDCCKDSCECQPRICGFSWQPLADIESSCLFFDILSIQPFRPVSSGLNSQEVLRKIFHPPKHLC